MADLKARRLELTRASLRETILGGNLDSYRVAVESLAEEFELLDIAAAGVKLVHQASGAREDEPEIPSPFIPAERPRPRFDGPPQAGGFTPAGPPRPFTPRPKTPRFPDSVSIFIGAGRGGGVRPADLFGAITNEAGIASKSIGAIEIAERFSLVEVAGDVAEQVISALRGTKIRGQKVVVRREREERTGYPRRGPGGPDGPA
ncbi:MAG: DbpA RNA binding domain-containing protein [Acidobacteria bacterium]|nr:DbpA RNA binding domain-containing protein [Acidobacteriota bacterium]